jgi:hypothetical protein
MAAVTWHYESAVGHHQESVGSLSASERHGGVGTVQMLQGSATE